MGQNTLMAAPAQSAAGRLADTSRAEYEQPLNERMRTFMRLEFLYRQLLADLDAESIGATRGAVATLLEILAILMRGDLRSEVHKELDVQVKRLQRFQSQPEVDDRRLNALLGNLIATRDDVDAVGTGFLQPLKDSEFLSAIKHRSAIPGGTCEFDLPEFNHWLRQPWQRRREDLDRWLTKVRPVCDAVLELLWLIRESAVPEQKTAINGMYQHRMQKDSSCHLLRVTLPEKSSLYPEISGSQHRFTVRFLEWVSVDARAVQTGHDVRFLLAIC